MRRTLLYALMAVVAALVLSACGTHDDTTDLPNEDDPEIQRGALLFHQRCQSCHTLSVVGGVGSAFRVNDREYKDGPNFNQRVVTYDQVLYAIRNGGFSSGPMPQNIVVGENAEAVAKFLAKYSGGDVGRATTGPEPGKDPAGVVGESPVEQEDTDVQGEEIPPSDEPPPPAARDIPSNSQPDITP